MLGCRLLRVAREALWVLLLLLLLLLLSVVMGTSAGRTRLAMRIVRGGCTGGGSGFALLCFHRVKIHQSSGVAAAAAALFAGSRCR